MPILEVKSDGSALRRILRALVDALFHRGRSSENHSQFDAGGSCAGGKEQTDSRRSKAIRERLAAEARRLERLEAERERRHDSRFGKTVEDRIVWAELIELELQEIDDSMRRTGGTAGGSEGGPHERDDA